MMKIRINMSFHMKRFVFEQFSAREYILYVYRYVKYLTFSYDIHLFKGTVCNFCRDRSLSQNKNKRRSLMVS